MQRAVPLTQSKKEIIYIEIDDSTSIVVPDADGTTASTGRAEALVERLSSLGDSIAAVCRTIKTNAVAAMEDAKPSELEIEFGLKLGGEAGVPLVTKGTTEANITVKAKWQLAKG